MPAAKPRRHQFVAVLTAMIAALLSRSWLQLTLVRNGIEPALAADLSYLLVPPLLLLLLCPLISARRQFFVEQFNPHRLTVGIAIRAILVGLLLRLAFWCYLVAGISFGWIAGQNAVAEIGPRFAFECRSPQIVAFALLVTAVLVPLVEEVMHRALIVDSLRKHGATLAILLSATVFTLFHAHNTWPIVGVAGLIFATQYWLTGMLWASLIAHATFNALIQLDWFCLQGHWNPSADQLPLWIPGTFAVVIGLLGLLAIAALINVRALGGNRPAEGH